MTLVLKYYFKKRNESKLNTVNTKLPERSNGLFLGANQANFPMADGGKLRDPINQVKARYNPNERLEIESESIPPRAGFCSLKGKSPSWP